MILNHSADIYSKTVALNSERKTITTYAINKSGIRCNVQPLQLSDVQRNGWGISDLDANAKIMFISNIDAIGIIEDWIVKWNGQEFFIKGINLWDAPGAAAHTEFKLRPIQGQSYT